jgi:hypothetical protein
MREYRTNFAQNKAQHGAETPQIFKGDDALRNFLISIQDPTMKSENPGDRADQWLRDIRASGTLALDHVELTESQAAGYRRTA